MHDDPVQGEARSLLERLARTQAALDRERAEAPSLCARLLELPPGEQIESLRAEPRLHTWGVCEVLLEKSLAAAETDAAESGRLAILVLTASNLLDEALHVAPVVQDLEARAWACLGEARLRAGDLPGAEEALREGAARLAHGTGDLLVEARLLEFEASVRRQQGRTSEAAALLKQAESRYREANEHHLAARTHHKRDQVLQQADSLLRNIVFEPTS
jgi:tetratricopeptide (TPR) repeat protein